MAYSQQSDLNLDSQRLAELTDNASAVGVIDTTLLASLQVEADAVIDGYLEGTYITPLAATPGATPAPIRYASANVWRFLLYKHREEMDIPEGVRSDYERTIRTLEGYAMGRPPLKAALRTSAASSPTLTAGGFTSDNDDRRFGRAKDGLA